MRLRRKLLLVFILLVVAACASPLLVPPALRLWIGWTARRDRIVVKIDKIETPFLRPVVLHGLHLTSPPDASSRVQLSAELATVHLNLRGILSRTREPWLRNVEINKLQLQVHRNDTGNPFPEESWRTWQKLLPKQCKIDGLDLRIEDGSTVVLMRGGALSFSEVEAGRVSADELTIASPAVRRTFPQLHGATHWQEDRLTLAGINLTRGLDVQTISFDLAHLSHQRLGVEVDLDVFGGKIRGNMSTEWRSPHSHWNIAASAADISLGQTAEAIGLADRIAGQMHACKFTFRGDSNDLTNATASVWTELTAPAWHDRQADLVMIGAALYNRQIAVQQLYVKQDKNQMTMSGEIPLPEKISDWLTADFRADISASIKNLGEFAKLFGRTPAEFSGELAIDGGISSHSHKLAGTLSATGNSLRLFNSPVDQFATHLKLTENVVEFSDLNLKRKDDYLIANGKIDISHPENRLGTLETSIGKISTYWPKSQLDAALFAKMNLTGNALWFDFLQLRGPTTVEAAGKLDFSDPKTLRATFNPLHPITEIAPPNASDCIDQLQIVTIPKGNPPLPAIEKIDIEGDLSGVHNIVLTINGALKNYRTFCADVPNGSLQLGASPP